MWPNDGDGLAWADPKRGFPPGWHGGLQADRPGPVSKCHRGLHRADLHLQGRRSRSSPACHPAGLDHLLEAGLPAGVQAEGRHGRQGAPVPGSVEALGIWRRPVHRGLVDPVPPVQVVAHRRERRGARRRLHEGNEEAVDPAARLHHALFEVAVDVLKRTAALDDKSPSSTPSRPPTSTPSWGRSAGPAARANVAKTALVGGQWGRRQDVPLRHGHRQQPGGAEHPRRRQAPALSARRERPRPAGRDGRRPGPGAPMAAVLALPASPSRSGRSASSTTSARASSMAKLSGSSGRTAPARPRRSTSLIGAAARRGARRLRRARHHAMPPHARCRTGLALTPRSLGRSTALTVFENVLVGGVSGRAGRAPGLRSLASRRSS